MSTNTSSRVPCTCHTACAYEIGLPPRVFCKERATAAATGHPPLVWCDLETTGLDPSFDQLLEVAFIVTNAELQPQGVYHAVVHHRELVSMNEVVLKMHGPSGLLDAVRGPDALPLWRIERELADFFRRNDVTDKSPLAGSTVHFDRSFLRLYLPNAHARLHYRNVDVSTLRELVKRWNPDALWTKGDRHRALPDCFDSIAQLQHYRKVGLGRTSE